MRKFFANRNLLYWSIVLGFFTPKAVFSVTQYKEQEIAFTTKVTDLHPSIVLDTKDQLENLPIPVKRLKARAKKFEKDERIEPIQIYLPKDKNAIQALAKDISRPGKSNEVFRFLNRKASQDKSEKTRILADLDYDTSKNLNLNAVGKLMSRAHHNVSIDIDQFIQNKSLKAEFLRQLKPFLSLDQRINIAKKMKKRAPLTVSKELLPKFARKMVGNYTIFRGPNCFHAALAFHGQSITKSRRINVKREKGYHRAMINYDELWRAINRHFYEVDPNKSPLKYGDMLVFMDIPDAQAKDLKFRWIRHTATYLFDKYTFSKGSKSANTPYSIKTLGEEWQTWQKYTKNLGLKVYRRANPKMVQKTPEDLTDWIF